MYTDTLTTTNGITYTVLNVPSGGYVTVQASLTYGDIMVTGMLIMVLALLLFGFLYLGSRAAVV